MLYGHGQENICLSVSADTLSLALRHGSRLVDLTGAVSESAFIRDMQWDTWGTHVLARRFDPHLGRRSSRSHLTIELRGEAPGVREGGVVNQLIHDVEISCPAGSIPEKLQVNINHLNLDESITLADLKLPQGAKLLAEDLDAIIVECIVPQELPEEGAAEAVPGEPEVIGAKKEEEGERRVIAYETCGWAGQSGPKVPGHSAQHRLCDTGRVGPQFRHVLGKTQVSRRSDGCGNRRTKGLAPQPADIHELSADLSVSEAKTFYKIPDEDLLVLCDDLNLPLGKLRIRMQGSSGGQKGLDDIIRNLGTENFSRLRVGIGSPPEGYDWADFVLSKFSAERRFRKLNKPCAERPKPLPPGPATALNLHESIQ